MKNNIFSKLSLLLIFPLSFLLVNKIQANSLKNNVRVVALTSLTADMINTISKDALVGVPGSSILKKIKSLLLYQSSQVGECLLIWKRY